jgi:hypothetical protein
MKFRVYHIAVLLGLSVISARAETPVAQSNSEQIASWIKELQSDSFIDREKATEHLIEVGEEAVRPLIAAAQSKDREVMFRSVLILNDFAINNLETPLSDSAWKALKDVISQNTGRSAARRAETALQDFYVAREARAVTRLQDLGANLEYYTRMIDGRYVPVVTSVVVGDTWTGEVKDLHQIRWLRTIERVTLKGEKVRDDWVEPITEISHVGEFAIKKAKITAACLPAIRNMKQLSILKLHYLDLDNGSLDTLKELTQLTKLELYGTKFTRANRHLLQDALVSTNVDIRQGGFLGVGCEQITDQCTIAYVHSGSAAHKAQLRPGDVVVKYDGKDVADFEALTELISENKAGDEITIDVSRTGTILTKKMVLGEWE